MLVGDEHQDLLAAMGRADAQVAYSTGVAQRDFAIVIDPVSAGAVFGFMRGIRCGFGQGRVGLDWSAPVDGSVGSLGVIPGRKGIQ